MAYDGTNDINTICNSSPLSLFTQTPEGQELQSSSEENGTFHLLVPNPPSGGNYTCSLPPLSPTTRCVPSRSPLLQSAGVHVDQVKVSFTLLEARQAQLAAENSRLRNDLARITTENNQLRNDMNTYNEFSADFTVFSETLRHLVDMARNESKAEIALLRDKISKCCHRRSSLLLGYTEQLCRG